MQEPQAEGHAVGDQECEANHREAQVQPDRQRREVRDRPGDDYPGDAGEVVVQRVQAAHGERHGEARPESETGQDARPAPG